MRLALPESQISRRTPPMKRASRHPALVTKRLQATLMLVLLLAYLGMLYVGPEIILPTQANDARSVAVMSASTDEVDAFDGYAAMAMIYSYTNVEIRYLILISIAAAYFWTLVRNVENIVSAGIVLFLSIAPIVLFLCFFVKDTMYLAFMAGAALILRKIPSNLLAACIVAILFTVYAVIFRQYFLLIAALFPFTTLFRQSPVHFKISILIISLVIMYFLPAEIYYTLHDARDFVNRQRIGFSGAGYRTAFMNLLPPDGIFGFLINYGYAIIRLNFPIIFQPGTKELFLTVNVSILGYLAFLGLSSPDRRIWRPALLFLSHFMVLMIFEPDYGSYLRHIMTSAPLLGPALLEIGSRRRNRNRLVASVSTSTSAHRHFRPRPAGSL